MSIVDKTENKKSLLSVIVGAILYSSAILFTRMTHNMNPMSIAFYRSFFALFIFLFISLMKRNVLSVDKYKKYIFHLMGLGIFVGITVGLYIYSIQNTTAANASLLVNLSPIYIALLAPILLNEKRPKNTYVSLGMVLLGVLLITDINNLQFSLSSLDGLIAGFFSGITFSFTHLISRSLKGKVTGFLQTLWGTAIAGLILFPFAIKIPVEVVKYNLPVLIPLGIFSLGLPSFLYYKALQVLKAQVVSIVALLEPVSGVLIGVFLFDEVPSIFGIIGIVLVLSGIYLISKE